MTFAYSFTDTDELSLNCASDDVASGADGDPLWISALANEIKKKERRKTLKSSPKSGFKHFERKNDRLMI